MLFSPIFHSMKSSWVGHTLLWDQLQDFTTFTLTFSLGTTRPFCCVLHPFSCIVGVGEEGLDCCWCCRWWGEVASARWEPLLEERDNRFSLVFKRESCRLRERELSVPVSCWCRGRWKGNCRWWLCVYVFFQLLNCVFLTFSCKFFVCSPYLHVFLFVLSPPVSHLFSPFYRLNMQVARNGSGVQEMVL